MHLSKYSLIALTTLVMISVSSVPARALLATDSNPEQTVSSADDTENLQEIDNSSSDSNPTDTSSPLDESTDGKETDVSLTESILPDTTASDVSEADPTAPSESESRMDSSETGSLETETSETNTPETEGTTKTVDVQPTTDSNADSPQTYSRPASHSNADQKMKNVSTSSDALPASGDLGGPMMAIVPTDIDLMIFNTDTPMADNIQSQDILIINKNDFPIEIEIENLHYINESDNAVTAMEMEIRKYAVPSDSIMIGNDSDEATSFSICLEAADPDTDSDALLAKAADWNPTGPVLSPDYVILRITGTGEDNDWMDDDLRINMVFDFAEIEE